MRLGRFFGDGDAEDVCDLWPGDGVGYVFGGDAEAAWGGRWAGGIGGEEVERCFLADGDREGGVGEGEEGGAGGEVEGGGGVGVGI